MGFNLDNTFFLYQDCSGLSRLDLKENSAHSFPIFPEFRRQINFLPPGSFFSGRVLIKLKLSVPIRPVFRTGFFLVSNQANLGFSFTQLLSLSGTPFLPISVFPFLPVDLFLS